MLTPTQTNYLNKLPKEIAEKSVEIYPWNNEGLRIANAIVTDIKLVLPQLEVVFIGSTALRIAGQKDIDLSVLSSATGFPQHQKRLENLFGLPDKLGKTSIAWHFIRGGYEVGVYLTDPVTSQIQEQIQVFNLLKENGILLKEYEDLKKEAAGLPYREYQIRKYEFYNKILDKN